MTSAADTVEEAPISGILWVVFGASFLFSLGYGVTFLLPLLFAGFGATEAEVGETLGAASIATLIAVLYAGHLSDAIGRARAVAFGGVLMTLALAGFALSMAYTPLTLALGLLLGAGWGLFYCLSQILIAMFIPPEQRARYFLISHAFIMAGIGGGPMVGPLVVGAEMPVAAAFWVAALGTLLASLLFWVAGAALHESGAGHHDRASLTLDTAKKVLQSESRYPIIMVGIGGAVFSGFHAYQTTLAAWAGVDYVNFFVTYTLTVVFFRSVLSGFMGRLPLYKASTGLLFCMTLGSGIFLVIDGSRWLHAVAAFLLGIGYGITYALIKTIVVNESPPAVAPQAMQLFNLSYFVGIFGFPLAAGYVLVFLNPATLVILLTALAALEMALAGSRSLKGR